MSVLQLQPDTDFDISLFNQDVDLQNYTFQTSYNDRLELWILTIFDQDKNAIASMPILNETPLFRLYSRDSTEIFSSDVILTDDLGSKVQCGRDGLNFKYTLTLIEG